MSVEFVKKLISVMSLNEVEYLCELIGTRIDRETYEVNLEEAKKSDLKMGIAARD